MKADLQPSPKNTSAPEALEHSQPLLYALKSIAEMPWDTADGTPSPPASPAASRGAASPVTPEGAPRPQPLLPLSVPTAFHIEAQLERYRQAQEALLADTGIIQDLKAKNRRLQQDLAALAQAKLQHAGTIPTFGAALAAAADGIDQLVGGLMAAFIWLIAAAWRATLCTCAAAWHAAYYACAAAWWAWACRGWAARWAAARAVRAAAPLVTRISDTATSAARHTLSFAVAALRHSRQLAQQASATVQHSTAAARTCMGTWTAMVAGKVAGKVAAALDMVRRSAAAAYQGASHSAATAGAAARLHVTATAATAKHTALRATRLVAAQVQARPCSSIASALLAAFLLGRLTSPGLPPAVHILTEPTVLGLNGTCALRPAARSCPLPPSAVPSSPSSSGTVPPSAHSPSHTTAAAAATTLSSSNSSAFKQSLHSPATLNHPSAARSNTTSPTLLADTPTPAAAPDMLLYPLPPPIFELGFAASRHLFPAPSSTVLLNSAPALQAADWLALHPSVHAALDIASRAAALTQFLAAGHSMPLSNATIDRAGPPLKLPALPTALPGGSTIAHLLSKAFIAVPRAEWIVTTVPSFAFGALVVHLVLRLA